MSAILFGLLSIFFDLDFYFIGTIENQQDLTGVSSLFFFELKKWKTNYMRVCACVNFRSLLFLSLKNPGSSRSQQERQEKVVSNPRLQKAINGGVHARCTK